MNLDDIAAYKDLQNACRWVAWKRLIRNKDVTKPPIDPQTGGLANITDPSVGADFETAYRYSEKNACDGVGFILRGEEGLIAIDLDKCVGPDGVIAPWAQEVLDLNETFAEFSPSGTGIHIIARGALDRAVVCPQVGVEIYARARYITLSGEQVPGCSDSIGPASATLAKLRQRVEAYRSKREVEARRGTKRTDVAVPQGGSFFRVVNDAALKDLDAWVPDLLPAARVSNQGYRVRSVNLERDLQEDLAITSMGIKDFGVSDQGDPQEGRRTAIDLVQEYATNIDLDLKELEGFNESAQKAARGHNALKAAVWLAEKLGIDAVFASKNNRDCEINLAAMNSRYFVASDGGKTLVVSFQNNEIGGQLRSEPVFQTFEEFKKLYQNRIVVTEKVNYSKDGKKEIEQVEYKLGHWWLDHPLRQQYEGIIFSPNGKEVVNGKFNLWRGFAVSAIKGDWSLIRDHISGVLADGDKDLGQYIINWIAWCVQYPHKPIGSAVVFKGGKGTGKSVIGNLVKSFFGQHGLQLSSVQQFTGNFNAHLRDACLVFLDEAYWGGDKANDGALKRMITEPEIFIEPKGRNAFPVTNMLKIIMASNEAWVVPATKGERRYAVFNVSEARKGDTAYFDRLVGQIQNGGAEAMLYDLRRIDLSEFNPRSIPITQALLEQQEEGLPPLDAWFKNLLEEGSLPESTEEEPEFAYSDVLLDSCIAYNRGRSTYLNSKSIATYLKDRGCKKVRKSDNRRGFIFADLQTLRGKWKSEYLGMAWDDDYSGNWTAAPTSKNVRDYLAQNGIRLD